MAESITITLSKKMPLAQRISEAAGQINAWLKALDAEFNNEKDKLHLRKSEFKSNTYRYHYSVVRGKSSSAGKINMSKMENDPVISDALPTPLQSEEPLSGLSPNL